MKIMKIMPKTTQEITQKERQKERQKGEKNRKRKGLAAAVIALAVAAAAAGTSAYASSEDSASGGFFSVIAEVFSDLFFEDTDDAAAAVSVYSTDEADITNTYSTSMTTPVSLDALFNKVLTGRDWTEDDAFTFVIEAVTADAPLPEETTVTVTSDTAKDGEAVQFGFGEITFTEDDMEGAALNEDGYYQKTFTYTVTEVEGDNEGIDYATNAATLTVTVTDDGEGNLSGAPYVTAENNTFTNSYSTSMKFGTSGRIYLMKTLYGTTAEEGEFEFAMTAVDSDTVTAEETAEKLFGADAGLSRVYTNTALDYDGDTCYISLYSGLNIVFDQYDAGKTFACTLSETKGGGTGYTNDDTVYTVTIRIVDHGDGNLTAVHTITDDDGSTERRSFSSYDTEMTDDIYGLQFVNYYGDGVTVGGNSEVSSKTKSGTTSSAATAKEKQKITVKKASLKKTVKYKRLKKKKQTFKIKATAKGRLTYTKLSGSKKITVSKNGKVTIKKGLKKGTYKVKIKIKAAKTNKYKKAVVTKTLKITVK